MIPHRFRTAIEFALVMALLFAAIFLPAPAVNVARSLFGMTEVHSDE